MKLSRLVGFSTSLGFWLTLASGALAQSATSSGSKGGTGGALPNAGTTELTYILFVGGVILFVFGMLRLVASLRD